MTEEKGIMHVIKYMPESIGEILKRLISNMGDKVIKDSCVFPKYDICNSFDISTGFNDNIKYECKNKGEFNEYGETSSVIIEEIRLRCNKPLTIGIMGESCFVTQTGGITNYEDNAYKVSAEEVESAFAKVCENSVYAHVEEISRGYITICGGHRVGICGKAVCNKGKIETMTEVSSLNFRISHQLIGIADNIISDVVCGDKVESTLIIAKPQIGKTTLLRDIIRQISDRGFKCGIADDRSEIAAMYRGVPGNDIGAQTDIIDGAPKDQGVEILLRCMSPKVIATDEITTEEEAKAIMAAAGTGVNIIATTHGESVEEVKERYVMAPLFRERVFSRAILLTRDFSIPNPITKAKVVRL